MPLNPDSQGISSGLDALYDLVTIACADDKPVADVFYRLVMKAVDARGPGTKHGGQP